MAAVLEEKKIDVVLPQSEKSIATEVMEFLGELNQTEQKDFMNFLQGAKFAMGLNNNTGKAI